MAKESSSSEFEQIKKRMTCEKVRALLQTMLSPRKEQCCVSLNEGVYRENRALCRSELCRSAFSYFTRSSSQHGCQLCSQVCTQKLMQEELRVLVLLRKKICFHPELLVDEKAPELEDEFLRRIVEEISQVVDHLDSGGSAHELPEDKLCEPRLLLAEELRHFFPQPVADAGVEEALLLHLTPIDRVAEKRGRVRRDLLDQRFGLDAALLHGLLRRDSLALLLGRRELALLLFLGLEHRVRHVFILLQLPQLGHPRRELLQGHRVGLLVGGDEVGVVARALRETRLEVREGLRVGRRGDLVDSRLRCFHLLRNFAMDERVQVLRYLVPLSLDLLGELRALGQGPVLELRLRLLVHAAVQRAFAELEIVEELRRANCVSGGRQLGKPEGRVRAAPLDFALALRPQGRDEQLLDLLV